MDVINWWKPCNALLYRPRQPNCQINLYRDTLHFTISLEYHQGVSSNVLKLLALSPMTKWVAVFNHIVWALYSRDKSAELQWEQACTCGPLTTHSAQSAETRIPVWRASHEGKKHCKTENGQTQSKNWRNILLNLYFSAVFDVTAQGSC